MTEDELQEIVSNHPHLYHMAEEGSWQSIRQYGLLSTTALLDLYQIEGEERETIERRRRPVSVSVNRTGLGMAVIRDQKPLTDASLTRALEDGLTPEDWYRLLNGKTFFWFKKSRLETFLCAGNYARIYHDVLIVDTESLVERHRERITLSPMNSGCSVPFVHKRGLSTFRRISDYPYADRKRRGLEPVVELVVDHAVPDIEEFTLRVDSMACNNTPRTIWRRGDP